MIRSRGFTLIEILVVIVVIALLVSITALNTDGDPRDDTLLSNAQRMQFYLEQATDEAILNNINLAINITRNKLSPYIWTKKPGKGGSPASTSGKNSMEDWMWSKYESRTLGEIEFDSSSEYKLYVNSTLTPLKNFDEQQNALTPQLIIQASGVQTIMRLEMSLENFDKSISVKGNGAGRYWVSAKNNEI